MKYHYIVKVTQPNQSESLFCVEGGSEELSMMETILKQAGHKVQIYSSSTELGPLGVVRLVEPKFWNMIKEAMEKMEKHYREEKP